MTKNTEQENVQFGGESCGLTAAEISAHQKSKEQSTLEQSVLDDFAKAAELLSFAPIATGRDGPTNVIERPSVLENENNRKGTDGAGQQVDWKNMPIEGHDKARF